MPYKDKSKQRDSQRIWAAKRATALTRRESKLKYKYGLTLNDFDILLKSQNGRCAICKKKPVVNIYLSVDHDHVTGKIRGLLCYYCNTGLGHFKDDLSLLQEAVKYLTPRVV